MPKSVACVACLLWTVPFSFAEEYEPIPEEAIHVVARDLFRRASKIEDLPVEINGDWSESVGLYRLDRRSGALLVPSADLIETDPEDPRLSEEKGLHVGTLFLGGLVPAESPDPKKLLALPTYVDIEGGEHPVRAAILTVKRFAEDDYRLQIWGSEKEPLAEAYFDSEGEYGEALVEMDLRGNELEILWLGRYPTSIPLRTIDH